MTGDRIADLERIVYGSGANEVEREDAARELLERRAAEHERAAAETADESSEISEPATAEASAEPDPTPQAADPADADPRRRVRRVLIAATAALVVGMLAGWQLGAREAAQEAELAAAAGSVFPGPRTQAEYLASLPVAADSPAAKVFDRPATAADEPGVPWTHAFGERPAEPRLLATRADGVAVFAVRDGAEYCLLVVLNSADVTSGAGCTQDGRFPLEGLSMTMGVSGVPEATVDVAWRPDGSLSVLVPGESRATPAG